MEHADIQMDKHNPENRHAVEDSSCAVSIAIATRVYLSLRRVALMSTCIKCEPLKARLISDAWSSSGDRWVRLDRGPHASRTNRPTHLYCLFARYVLGGARSFHRHTLLLTTISAPRHSGR